MGVFGRSLRGAALQTGLVHAELKAVDLNMKDVIIQLPSGLLVSLD